MQNMEDYTDFELDPEVTYIENSGFSGSFKLSLPQSVALHGAFAATRGHIKQVRGIELSDEDLRNPKCDESSKLARMLLINVVSNIKEVNEEFIAEELGYKNMSSLLQGIDESYVLTQDELSLNHLNSVKARYRILLRTWASATEATPIKSSTIDKSIPDDESKTEDAHKAAVKKLVTKAIEYYKRDSNPIALDILYSNYAWVIDDVLDKYDDVPGWVSDEADEIFKQLFRAVDFNLVPDIEAMLREGLTSGIEDVLATKSNS